MKVRIGIDVGGTFTDAVCVNSETFELIGYLKIPTTHTANEGVSKGIVEACRKLLEKYKLDPADVTFIAHGTTQATNALLEGDVEDVGIVCVGEGASSYKSKMDTNIGDIELAKGKFLHTKHHYLDIKSESFCEEAYALAEQWKKEGIHVAVAASAFSVDDPSKEIQLMKTFSEKDFLSTGTHEVSKLYGLRVRTRTAAINASILPKMIETAVMTEDSVKKSGVAAPLMIMRCDGGVMDIAIMYCIITLCVFSKQYKLSDMLNRVLMKSATVGLTGAAIVLVQSVLCGVLVEVLSTAEVTAALEGIVASIFPKTQIAFIMFFAILAPLALFRGPTNIWGVGASIATLLVSIGVLPPTAVMAAYISCERTQVISDPTNTHNIWISGYVGSDTITLLKKVLPWSWLMSAIGVTIAGMMFF